jgi:hypothetical protein
MPIGVNKKLITGCAYIFPDLLNFRFKRLTIPGLKGKELADLLFNETPARLDAVSSLLTSGIRDADLHFKPGAVVSLTRLQLEMLIDKEFS